jgi:phenylacetate-CoA ligase
MFHFDPASFERRKEQRQEVIRFLRGVDPATLVKASEEAALAAFDRAYRTAPAYHKIVSEFWNGREFPVQDIESFKAHVPIIDKHMTFGRFPVRELCAGGSISGVRSVLTSSGHSGVISFGVNTEENLQNSSHAIDLGLQYMFDVDSRNTLLVNALPMGVKVHTKATTLAETSVRDDMVLAVVKAFAPDFDQFILVGEGSFIKKIIEDGAKQGIDWPKLPVSIIVGEEGIAENYRTYMGNLIGIGDPSKKQSKMLGSSMGVAELDLNIFHETHDTIRIRRLAHEDAKLRARLFGPDCRYCPMFFVYYPHRCLVEEYQTSQGEPELVLSMLSEQMRIPLIRYRTGDVGRVLAHTEVVAALKECGYDIEPDLKLPFVAVWGRDYAVQSDSGRLTVGAVKEALYENAKLAPACTGNFLLSTSGASLRVDIQLKPGEHLPASATQGLGPALQKYSGASAESHLRPYDGFPKGMILDYERKFSYLA